jgi:reactive intermediate/imine deaminase
MVKTLPGRLLIGLALASAVVGPAVGYVTRASQAGAAAGPAADANAPSQGAATAAPLPVFAPVTRHGDLVFASGVLAIDLRASGDITAQTTQVLDELGRRLARADTSLARIASATVYLANAEDFAAMNAVWARYFPADPPTRTTVIVPLPLAGARIQVSAVAAAGSASRTVILPKGWLTPSSPYSYGIRVGDTLFLSGLLSRRGADNAIVAGDITLQTRTVFDNAQAILGQAGFTLADVTSARVFITSVADFEAMNGVYRTYFPQAPPARATVKTGLTGKDFIVEMTFVAAKGGVRTAVVTPAADGTPGKPNPNLSSAIAVGPRLFLSGMLGVVPGTAPDPAAQTSETLARLGRTLTAAGFGWQDVVDSTVYVTDVSSADAVVRMVQQKIGRRSAGTVVGSGLVSADGRVEIMLTAGK